MVVRGFGNAGHIYAKSGHAEIQGMQLENFSPKLRLIDYATTFSFHSSEVLRYQFSSSDYIISREGHWKKRYWLSL